MKVRAVVFIADKLQGGDKIITKESLETKYYLLNPIVLENFDWTNPPIGKVTDLTWEGNKLIADIELKSEKNHFLASYPVIAYKYTQRTTELMSISLCPLENTDKRIKTLEEQTKSRD